ncbi:hypothetical protein EZS27_014624 [termite gut metagenome]|uniref:Uncharacterized protein n=1 Tax=termite gut metagenome TaxID=433724 RepID=A0A5J4RTH5_9ZZZZ
MKLGNSNGNNRNKKYLTKKIRLTTEPNIEKAEEFNTWFEENYKYLVEQEKRRQVYNEDVFNDTYLKIYDKVLYGANVEDYKKYFSRSYFTNYYQNNIIQSKKKNISMEDNVSNKEDETKEETERKVLKDMERDELITEIFEYVKVHYTIQEFELFKIYTFLKKQSMSYKKLSAITHLSTQYISSTISKIKNDITTNEELKQKRKELLK